MTTISFRDLVAGHAFQPQREGWGPAGQVLCTGVVASSASYLETIAPLSDDPLISLPAVAR
jgi:hypothetical protein